jgi:hypothetical protein
VILKSETYNFHRLDLTRQAGFIVTVCAVSDQNAAMPRTQRCATSGRQPNTRLPESLRCRSLALLSRPQLLDRVPRRGVESGATCVQMRDDGRAHARIPEFLEMLGNRRQRPPQRWPCSIRRNSRRTFAHVASSRSSK